MLNLSNQSVDIDCPKCKSKIKVTIKQVTDHVTVKCRCGQSINLVDKNIKNTINDINKTLDNLLKGFGK